MIATTQSHPWKVQALVDWLKAEGSQGKDHTALASDLNISQDLLDDWLMTPLPALTLENIHSIARYRGWTLDSTVQWLGICSAHLAELNVWARIDVWLKRGVLPEGTAMAPELDLL